jgi:hypothetical protein
MMLLSGQEGELVKREGLIALSLKIREKGVNNNE